MFIFARLFAIMIPWSVKQDILVSLSLYIYHIIVMAMLCVHPHTNTDSSWSHTISTIITVDISDALDDQAVPMRPRLQR